MSAPARVGTISQYLAVGLGALAVFGLLVGTLFSLTRAYVLSKAEDEIEGMLLQHKGVHHYVQRKNHPELYRFIASGSIKPEAYTPVLFSSSFMVRNMHVFYNEEREKAGMPPLYYKMAASNPRNPVNTADEYEARLIAFFNTHPEEKEYREIKEVDGKQYLYVAIPFLRNDRNCLKCHGKREESPPGLQALYPG
ncbi:MAG TPA: DUF3365 domain-containing protein, partial [Candidatus Ozemobacteraceae bacterium]|nr:DUF3365 domain-containing protein [Candidatus Ozemobacteraceae bacterium]